MYVRGILRRLSLGLLPTFSPPLEEPLKETLTKASELLVPSPYKLRSTIWKDIVRLRRRRKNRHSTRQEVCHIPPRSFYGPSLLPALPLHTLNGVPSSERSLFLSDKPVVKDLESGSTDQTVLSISLVIQCPQTRCRPQLALLPQHPALLVLLHSPPLLMQRTHKLQSCRHAFAAWKRQ